MIATAIRGFNQEWAAITSIRSTLQPNVIIGWRFQTACGTERKFLSAFWTDSYGAAVSAMEGHRCRNA